MGEDSTTTDSASRCVDHDGDSFGQGEACVGVDCDDDNPQAATNCLYIGPDGDDAAAGTREAPWRTFARAVTALAPGKSLIVLSGTYTVTDHGGLIASCADGDPSGTAESPIFVRSEIERQAHLATAGMGEGIRLEGCAYWRVRGLRLSSADAAGGENNIVEIDSSSHVELRRLLLHGSNRHFAGSGLVSIDGADDLTIEECEAYDFTGAAFWFGGGGKNVVRRAYVNGRGAADLPTCTDDAEPFCSEFGSSADYGVVATDGLTIENSILENTGIGVTAGGTSDNLLLGSVTIGGVHGAVFGYAPNSTSPDVTDLRVEHMVAVAPEAKALFLRTVADATIRNVTAVGGGVLGATLQSGTIPCPEAGCLIDAANLLAIDSVNDGLTMADGVPGVVVHHSNSVGSGALDYRPDDEPIDDDAGYWRHCVSVADDRVGSADDQCIAFIPSDSAYSGAGEDGEDIGASILYRYQNGVLGEEPLWDPQTGAFPCGEVILGVNDEEGTSCRDVHVRLHIGTPGCPLP